VIKQWCLWFELFNVIFKLLRWHWSFFIFLQCLGIVFGFTRPFDKNSDQTVMRQWWNSDAFDLSSLMQLQSFELSLIIFYPWIILQCLGGVLSYTRPIENNSDVTVMRQWRNSDATVTEQWCIWFELFNVIIKLLNCHWSYSILLQCLGSVFGDTRPFDQNSDQTDVKQWWDSYATVMEQWCLWFELFNIICKVLRWHWWYFIL
jgi:hypothetical protein